MINQNPILYFYCKHCRRGQISKCWDKSSAKSKPWCYCKYCGRRLFYDSTTKRPRPNWPRRYCPLCGVLVSPGAKWGCWRCYNTIKRNKAQQVP